MGLKTALLCLGGRRRLNRVHPHRCIWAISRDETSVEQKPDDRERSSCEETQQKKLAPTHDAPLRDAALIVLRNRAVPCFYRRGIVTFLTSESFVGLAA